MNRRSLYASLTALTMIAALSLFAAPSHARDPKPSTGKAAPPVASIGKAEDSKWTATTVEAAADVANKKVLASGKLATITGEVVDISCYLQLGKRGLAHVACGTKCINNGQPIGVVDAQDQLYLVFPEPHHPRRDGQAAIKDAFLPYLGRPVKVTGMMTNLRGGTRAIFVEPATAVAPQP